MAGKQERQRRLARERHERRQAREAQRQANQAKMTKIALSSAAIVVIAAVVVIGVLELGKSNKSNASKPLAPHSSTAPATPVSPSASATATPTPTSTPVSEPAHHCIYTPKPPAARNVGLPSAKPNYKASYQATIHTNRGAIVIDLLNSKATCTVNSFVFLAEKGYFSNTHCHRLTTSGIYVLQCGDPTGTGAGGPGYQFADENLTGATYTAATVAMANSGPNTNGSQFFLVYKNSTLSPAYTPFGKIVSGLNIIQQVANAGSDNSNGTGDGHPKEKVQIESVTIKTT